jgi:hypothetical protein
MSYSIATLWSELQSWYILLSVHKESRTMHSICFQSTESGILNALVER